MALLRNSVIAMTMIGAGLASTTGIALAHEDNDRVTEDSYKGLDASDSNNLSGLGVLCDIDALQGANIEDNTLSAPIDILTKSKHSPEKHAPGAHSTCSPNVEN